MFMTIYEFRLHSGQKNKYELKYPSPRFTKQRPCVSGSQSKVSSVGLLNEIFTD